MMYLPFDHVNKHDNYEDRVENIKDEKKMLADEMTTIIEKKLKEAGFLTKRERNVDSYNSNPCDLAAGDDKKFRIAGFEVKSDGDTYTRLTGQLDAYLFAFDEVYLVVHKKKIPEWLPREIGVLRVFENGDVVREKHPWTKDPFDISTNFEWDALFKVNNLGNYSSRTKEFINALMSIRKKIIFNRYFAEFEWGEKIPIKFFPFSEKEKTAIIGTDIKYHYVNAGKELKKLEKHIDILRKMLVMGQSGLKDFK